MVRLASTHSLFTVAGTTWVQEIVYLLKNNADTETAKSLDINDRFPLLEITLPGQRPSVDYAASMEGLRLLKSHSQPRYFQRAFNECQAKYFGGG